MMNEYKKIKLGDIVELSQGIQIPVDQQLPDSSHITQRFLRIVDYTKDNEPPRYVNVPQGRYNVNENDLVMVRYGSQTAGMIVRGKSGVIANNMFKMKANEEYIDKSYLYYYLSNPDVYKSLNHSQASSTMPAITFDMITSLEISLPPLPEQHRISAILSSFDNKIELLRKENNTLEDIAQSIFKEWFVKYNFPNKDGKPYRDNNGKMIDSELGLIPEGWRVGKLGEVSTITSGKNISKEDLDPKGIYDVLGANGVIGKTNIKLHDKELIYTGRVGTLGNVFLSESPAWFSDNTLLIFPKEHYFYYIYRYLQRQKLEKLDRGSTQPLITQTDIKNILLVNPIDNLLKQFNKESSIISKKIKRNNTIILNTEKIKTALLNKLIRIKNDN